MVLPAYTLPIPGKKKEITTANIGFTMFPTSLSINIYYILSSP
jgi:hypothetical protein